MANQLLERIKTISQYHQVLGLSRPEHPLISVINMASIKREVSDEPISLIFNFYVIALINFFDARFKYGQQEYDFEDGGLLSFMSPNQVFGIEFNSDIESKPSGWMLVIHPDFLWNTPLAKKIKHYEYFDYSVHEALFLSEKEENIIKAIFQNIEQEYQSNIDKFSQQIIISQIETLLNYAERFYQRQFITRKISNHKTLDRLESILNDYFGNDDLIKNGLPTVQHISESLNVSPNYLRGLLKTLTGLNTQQHIHEKLIQKAKEKLSTTNLSISEIAYGLGFEHSQSFSKFFKTKTKLSPMNLESRLTNRKYLQNTIMNFIETLKYRNEPLFYFGLICGLLAIVFFILDKTTSIQVAGVNAWNKPFKFALSIMLYSWAMAWYCFYLPSFNINFFSWTVVILLGFEIVYITIQAGRGQLSHFNTSTPFYLVLYQLMGLAATLVTLYTAYIGLLFFQNNFPDLPVAYLWGIRLGIILFVIFSFEGALMGARMAHTVGGEDGSAGIALLKWSKKYGDLRIAHFIGMHALQILPLLAYYFLKNTKTIFIVSSLYGLLAFYTLVQALNGKPFYKL